MPDSPLQRMEQLTLFADIKTDRQITLDAPGGRIDHRHHGAFDPIQAAILGTVADFALPDMTQGDGAPHLDEEFSGVHARVEHAMVLPKQLLTAVAGHRAKLVIDVSDPAAQIGLGKNRGGIHRPAVLLIHESGSLSLAVEPVQGSNTDAGNILQGFK
ncbi:hypothetical protein D9M71_382910 [compost metagenome]